MVDGKRKIVSVQEITGMEGNVITMQEIFCFQQKGLDAKGNVRGIFRFLGIRPQVHREIQDGRNSFATGDL